MPVEVGCERGVQFYGMQLIHGRTLAAVLRERRRQPGAVATQARGGEEVPNRPDLAAQLAREIEARCQEYQHGPDQAASTQPLAGGHVVIEQVSVCF